MRNNRVKVLQDKRFDYDGFGRLVRKRIGAHTEQHFRYDAQHRMTQVAVVRAGKNGEPVSQVFRYRYDALGRRIAKADAFGETTFTWEGLRLLQERRGGQCSSYVYEPGSYTPLARIDGQGALEPEHPASALALGDVDTERGKENSVPTTNGEWADAHHAVAGPVGGLARKLAALDKAQAAQPQPAVMENSPPTPSLAGAINVNERSAAPGARVYYFHTQANGLPEEMSDRNGNLVWRAQYRAWGSAVAEEWQAFDAAGRPVGAPVAEGWARASQQTAAAPQNLRMQGQYLDRETGLHYNTFRYYDPDLGAFTTPDPIGLAGGLNLHGYAPNPIAWVDPWGWIKCGLTGDEVGNATNLPVVRPGSPQWKKAVESIKSGGKSNFRTANKADAESLLKAAKGNIENKPTYTETPYKKGYEHHPNESHTVNAPENNIPHIKWKDWESGKSSGGAGHVFYDGE